MRCFARSSMAAFLLVTGIAAWTRPVMAQEEGAAPALPPFHDQLAPAGRWSHTEDVGWAWTPHVVPYGWRPYSQGRWEFSETHGWLWLSSSSWGEVPFHYGRWHRDGEKDWSWTPHTTWGPAWVAWRRGEGYVGWAPLPPAVRWDEAGGLEPEPGALGADIASDAWTFVEEGAFLAPRSIVVTPSTDSLLERTADVTKYTVVDRRIVNESLTLEEVEQFTRTVVRPVPTAALEPMAAPSEMPVEPDSEAGPSTERAVELQQPEETTPLAVKRVAVERPVPFRYRSPTVVARGLDWSLHDDQPWTYRPQRSWQYHPPRGFRYEPKRDWTYTPPDRRPYLTKQDWTYHPR